MSGPPKRILVVAHDRALNDTRTALLRTAGYAVESVTSDDDAIRCLETHAFDLILLGRNSRVPEIGLDQRLRQKYPDLLTLKIDFDTDGNAWSSRVVDAVPDHVIEALKEMLGE
jgi:DNA-binding NtrC family response regulator